MIARNSADGGSDYTNGRWYFSVSGTIYPTIAINSAGSEVWRMTNAGANTSYKLELRSSQGDYPMLMQVVSVDGVSIHVPRGTPAEDMIHLASDCANVAPCPEQAAAGSPAPICISDMVMLPGSSAKIAVAYPNQDGALARPPLGCDGHLPHQGITTG